MEIKLRIKELRKEKHLSQSEAAKIVGCSQQTYSRYESHITEMPYEALIRLSSYYNTSIDYLLGVTEVRSRY